MNLHIDMTNTGYFEDGWLRIDTVSNEFGYPDGTEFTITAYDDNGNDLGTKKFDFEELFKYGKPVTSSRRAVKSSKDDDEDSASFTVEDAVYEAFPMASPHTIEIITKWYENEFAAEDFDDVSDFSDYIYTDIYDMLDAATNDSEKKEVIEDLNNAGYID